MDNRFKEGGLEHDGGTKDPVSGNDVPIGSTQKEVRDDIPAQLSEGEYVIPADVVRFFGVKFFEELRMKAKDGMELLQAKGQMGNGDEQYVDDDVPFDMEDLDLDFNEGGVVYANKGTFASIANGEAQNNLSVKNTQDTQQPNTTTTVENTQDTQQPDTTSTLKQELDKIANGVQTADMNPEYGGLSSSVGQSLEAMGFTKKQIKLHGNDIFAGRIQPENSDRLLSRTDIYNLGQMSGTSVQAPGTDGSGVPPANFNYQYTKNDVGQASKYMSGVKATDQAALDLYDLNKDGKIDVSDTVAIANKFQEQEAERKKQTVEALKITTGITKNPTDEQMSRLDLDGDGQITIGDVVENAGGTRQPDPVADIDPVDPVDDKDKDEEDDTSKQTESAFRKLPIEEPPTTKGKPRSTFSQLVPTIDSILNPPKKEETPADDTEETPIDDTSEETDIGGQGGEGGASDFTIDDTGSQSYGFNAYTGTEITEADITAMEQSISALAGFTQGFTNEIGMGMSAALGVLGGLGVPGTGPLGKIGGTLNNAAAIYATAQQLGLEVSVLDAIQSAAVGFYDSPLGKQMTANQTEFGKAVTRAKNSAIEAVVEAGFVIDPQTGTVIDQNNVPAFPNINAMVSFYSKYGLLLDKEEKAGLKSKAQEAVAASRDLEVAGLPMDASMIAEFAENMGVTAAEVAQSVIDQAAMGLEPFGGSSHTNTTSTSKGIPNAALAKAAQALIDAVEGSSTTETDTPQAMGYEGDVDEGGSEDDVGNDPESESDPDPDDENKGGFITKRKASGELKPKFKKRKGLAARK